MANKENKASSAYKSNLKIESIPKILRVYGFLLMILIFSSVLLITSLIKIPMSYNGIITEIKANEFNVKLLNSQKSEYLPEVGDTISLKKQGTKNYLGRYKIIKLSYLDSLIRLQSDKAISNDFENSEIIIQSTNKSLFQLVLERFYK